MPTQQPRRTFYSEADDTSEYPHDNQDEAPATRWQAARSSPVPQAPTAPPTPTVVKREQPYRRAKPGTRHYTLRDMPVELFTRLREIARDDFDGRPANWLILRLLSDYVADYDAPHDDTTPN